MKLNYKTYLIKDNAEMLETLGNLKASLPWYINAREIQQGDRAIEIDIPKNVMSEEDQKIINKIAEKYTGLKFN
jgi:hypothetical protein